MITKMLWGGLAAAVAAGTAAVAVLNVPGANETDRVDFGTTVTVTDPAFDARVAPPTEARIKEFRIPMTHRRIEIAPGVKYDGWTFGNTVPGPVIPRSGGGPGEGHAGERERCGALDRLPRGAYSDWTWPSGPSARARSWNSSSWSLRVSSTRTQARTTGVQTYAVPAGGGAVFETEFNADASGQGVYAFVTHAFAMRARAQSA